MNLFSEQFLKTPLEQRPVLVDEYRQQVVIGTPESYVAVPVIVPKMSGVVQGAVADYELFWLVGLPGPIDHPKYPDKKAREAINFQCSREETAMDMVYMLNQARLQRGMLDNADAMITKQDVDLEPNIEDALTAR
jgi:hypothetical protein